MPADTSTVPYLFEITDAKSPTFSSHTLAVHDDRGQARSEGPTRSSAGGADLALATTGCATGYFVWGVRVGTGGGTPWRTPPEYRPGGADSWHP